MSLAQDLMGLGISPLQAAHTASAGTGPVTAVATGTSYGTATKIGAYQFLVSVTGVSSTTVSGLALPAVGGDAGCLIGDDFIVNNATTSPVVVYAPANVNISGRGVNQNNISLNTHTTATLFSITTSQWICVVGTSS
jgi:hypothetical protein